MNFSTGIFPGFGIWIGLTWLLTAVVHIGFAFAVLSDAGTLSGQNGRRSVLVGTELWALATLLGGVFVAALYWLLHHSSLRPQTPH